jgi:ATP-binding cassette subfamily B protein
MIPNTPAKFLIYITKPYKWGAFFTILLVIASAATSQSLTLFFKWIIEAIERQDLSSALWFGLLYPIAVFVAQMLMRASSVVAAIYWFPASRKYANDILVEYTTGHSQSYFADRFAGALLTKINNVIGAIENLLHDFLWSYLSLFVSLSVSFYFICTVDLLAGLIFLVLTFLIIFVNRSMLPTKRRLSRQVAAAATKMRGVIVDVFSNMSIVRQYVRREEEQVYIADLSARWAELQRKNWLFSDLTQVINSVILLLCGMGIFYVLTLRWEQGAITSAEFIFVLAIIMQLTGSLIFIGRMMVNAARVAGEMEEGLKDIIIPRTVTDVTNAPKISITQGTITFNTVNFNHENTNVFSDFSLTIPAGQRLGLVGPSGAGKSTFVSLLLRQYDIENGSIDIDGQNIATVTQDSLRAAIAVVPQEPALFHRTIRENIAYGKPDATPDEIIDVAKKAYAHDFIASLPLGYDTLVGERGVKLSGGQKQRIAIARAMLKNAPILVLDEATSALDSESEVEIQKALHILMVGKTVIAIAHRLSTLREMDRIIVLDNGAIAEDGTHDTLLTYGGTYARLWAHQAGGFLEG